MLTKYAQPSNRRSAIVAAIAMCAFGAAGLIAPAAAVAAPTPTSPAPQPTVGATVCEKGGGRPYMAGPQMRCKDGTYSGDPVDASR